MKSLNLLVVAFWRVVCRARCVAALVLHAVCLCCKTTDRAMCSRQTPTSAAVTNSEQQARTFFCFASQRLRQLLSPICQTSVPGRLEHSVAVAFLRCCRDRAERPMRHAVFAGDGRQYRTATTPGARNSQSRRFTSNCRKIVCTSAALVAAVTSRTSRCK